jgi:hypothetical protein
VWSSISPGATIRPLASIVLDPRSALSLMASMRLPTMPTWATRSKPLSGSMTRPLAITMS